MLNVDSVSRSFGDRTVLRDVSFPVGSGKLTGFVGANGAGKTTTMRAISGLNPLSGGRISFEGRDITTTRADLRVPMGICERIVVLNFGKTIATGTPEEIRSNDAVVEAYLGEPAAEAHL